MALGAELSCKVALEPWPADGVAVELEADARARAALARRFELEELKSLVCGGRLTRSSDGLEIRFHGRLRAEVVQTCVISLEPVPASLDEEIERRFWCGPASRLQPAGDDVVVDPDEVDLEPLSGDTIDLGAVVAEEFGLALDPYPRAENAYALLPDLGSEVSFGRETRMESPFAALRVLQEKRSQ